MNLRDATPSDALAIAAIWNHYIENTLVTFTSSPKTGEEVSQLIRTRQNAGQPFLVGEANEEEGDGVAGFATYGPFRAGPGYAASAEHTLLLAPKATGRGLGRALMGALEERARAGGLHVLVGGISSANPDAIAFHTAMGFTTSGRLAEVGRKGGLWLDLVLMSKLMKS